MVVGEVEVLSVLGSLDAKGLSPELISRLK
jgi:hypothetical protein